MVFKRDSFDCVGNLDTEQNGGRCYIVGISL